MRTLRCLVVALLILSCRAAEAPEPRDTTSIAWINCDGDGGFVVYLTPYALGMDDPARGCVVLHELDHIEYLEETGNEFCAGRARGTRVSVSRREIVEMECRAYARQRQCLWMAGEIEQSLVAEEIAESRFRCRFD